ncbi:MAG TPA: PQQ-dependent sugar dehydrogenase [Acidimicrobiia bacterium]|nr:PQQ-dependent sugar dehydrogenase [Acidimicrobiia bacterium]
MTRATWEVRDVSKWAATRLRVVMPCAVVALMVATLVPVAHASTRAVAPQPIAANAPNVTGLPAGFSIATVQNNLDDGPGGNVTSFAYAPDGRIFVARKTGVLDVWDHGVQHIYIDLRDQVNTYQSRGLVGFAIDPNFASNGRVYVLYTEELDPGNPDSPEPAGGQLVSLTNKPGQPDVGDPSSERVLMTGFDSTATLHSVAGLRFGPDGTLYVGLGDGNGNGVGTGTSINALNLDDLRGKVLRVDPTTGNGVASNPYYDAANPHSVRSRVFARGFRNPFRFTIDPTNGTLYVGDVGWNTWEMFQVFPQSASNPDVQRDAGWPCYEGGDGISLVQPDYQAAPQTAPICHSIYTPAEGGTGQGAVPPLYGYRHDDVPHDVGSAIVGGPRYLGTSNYPSPYVGKLFLGDYARARMQTLDLSNGHATDFGTSGTWGNPVDIQIAPDGNVAFLAFGPGTLDEIVYTSSGNRPPVAVAHADHTSTTGNSLTVHFSSAGSSDPDGDHLSYLWNFGDGGAPSTSANPVHTFGHGAFTATLLVSDGRGGSASANVHIRVGVSPPQVSFTAPATTFRFRIGSTIPIAVHAVDPQDGPLTGDSVSTSIDYWTGGHRFPVNDFDGVSGSFVAADQGFVTATYRITTTATDSDGLSTTITRNVLPVVARVTIDSQPSGITLSADGVSHRTPYTFSTIAGSEREIAAPAAVSVGGADFDAPAWSEGGRVTHNRFLEYVAPAGSVTAKVTYAVAPTTNRGYRIVSAAGVVQGFGLSSYGDLRGHHLAAPIVGLASTPNRRGYWLLGSDGGVFSYGSARFYGSTGGLRLTRPVLGLAAPRAGGGYWLVASDGGIFSFGATRFYGSTGAIHLNRPIVGMAPTPSGHGYWLVASDGGIFAFGDARFYGSTGGLRLNRPIIGIEATPSGHGYELAADDGGIFTFGDAEFFGSLGSIGGDARIVGLG